MSKGGKKGPSSSGQSFQPVDPVALANAQSAANRITQFTPGGDLIFGNVNATGDFTPQAGAALNVVETPAQSSVRQNAELGAVNLAAQGANQAAALGQGSQPSFEGLAPGQFGLDLSGTPTPTPFQPGGAFPDPFAGGGPLPGAGEGQVPGTGQAFSQGVSGKPIGPFGGGPVPGGLGKQGGPQNLGPENIPGQFAGDAQRVEQATFDRGFNLLKPELDFQQRRLNQTLANRGIPTGSELEQLESGRFGRQRGDLLSNLALQSVGAGRAEQGRLFGQHIAGRGVLAGEQQQGFGQALSGRAAGAAEQQQGFGQQLSNRGAALGEQLQANQLANLGRQTGFAEQQAVRSGQFNELASLLGLQQVGSPALGGFVQPGQVDVTGPFALAQQGALAQQQMQNQFNTSQLGGLYGLGGALGTAGILSGA